MPPAIAAFAAWASISVAAAYVVVATVVISVGTAVYGAAQARKAERKARDELNASMKDRMVTRIATEAPHRYIYGRAKVGADIVAMFTTGDKDQFRHLVCVHAAHECDAIEEVWVNNAIVDALDNNGDPTAGRFAVDPDNEVTEEIVTGPTFTLRFPPIANSVWVFSGAGSRMQRVAITSISGQTVTVAQSGQLIVSYERYVLRRFNERIGDSTPKQKNPVVRVQRHLGNASDEADAYLRSVVGDKWPATSVLRGMCYTVITLDLNHTEFQSGLVPIHAVIRGRKLYDPRDGVTRWSQNAALAVMDYLTSPLCAVPMSDLPLAQFITAANVCDEAMPTGGPRYTINGTVSSDQDQKGVLESMAQAMAGGLVATTWDVYAGKFLAPVAALTQDDIVGSLSINPGVSDASVYNGVKGQYIGPENKYVQTDFQPYQNPTYREADGRDLYTNIDFPFTESLQRVTNLARVFTEDQRNGFTIKAEFSLKAWPLKVGQRITYTSKFLGQNAKVYRITDKSYAPNSAVQLTLKEDAASIWDYADATVLDSTPNTDLPDPWKVDAPASLSCTSGEATLLRQADGSTVPRILATWPAMAQASGVQVEIEWRAVSSPTWERTTVSADETQAYLSPITPGFFYVVRARCVNPSLNARSNAIATVYQVEVFNALATVYQWSATKPVAPNGSATYNWSTGSFDSAPSGWSASIPQAPAGGGASLWAAPVLVTDVSAGMTPFQWGPARVSLVDENIATGLIAAQTAATAAAVAISDMARDDLLSPSEKPAESLRWITIVGERPGIDAQAAALGVTTERTAYATAYSALNTYVTGLGSQFATIPGVAISIVGATYRSTFKAYYDAKQALLNAIAAKTATIAQWAGVTGPGRPADNATVGADATNFTGLIGGDNLTSNSSFEVMSNGTLADGFTVYNNNAGAEPATASSGTGRNGTGRAQVITWTTARLSTKGIRGVLCKGGWQPNRTYVISVYCKTTKTAGSANVTIAWNTAPTTTIWVSAPTLSGEWQRYAWRVTMGATVEPNGTGYISISGGSGAGGDIWFDDLMVVEGDVLPAYYPSAAEARELADAAKTAAIEASNQAALANAAIANISSDSVLSKGEKAEVVLKWESIVAERGGLAAQAAALGVSNAGYWTAHDALRDFLSSINPGYSDTTKDSPIDGSVFRTRFTDYFAAKQALLNAIAAQSATVAQWTGVSGAGRPADNASADLTLAGWGTVVVTGNRAVKTSGSAAWDSSATSRESYVGGAYASVRTEGMYDLLFGLNTDPDTDSHWSSLDFAMEIRQSGEVYAWESGALRSGLIGAYSPGDMLAVIYDGSFVRYCKNGIVLFTSAIPAPIVAPLFFDSSLNTVGAALSNIRFGPMTSNSWGNIGGSGKPSDGATVGAPSGTNVAGVPAEQVAAGANAINSVLSATLSGTAGGGTYPNGSAGYGYLQVNISGGTAPYTVRWILTEDYTTGVAGVMRMSQKTGTSTSFSGSGTNATLSYDVTAIVTDAKQKSVNVGKPIIVNHGTPV